MNKIKDFNVLSNEIITNKKDIKLLLKELTNNLYSSINQLNFSVKTILDFDTYMKNTIMSKTNFSDIINEAINTQFIEVDINMYSNIYFNIDLINGLSLWEEIFRHIQNAIGNDLTSTPSWETYTPKTIEDMIKIYSAHIMTDIEPYWTEGVMMTRYVLNKYKDIINMEINNTSRTYSQLTLLNQLNSYKKILSDLNFIFLSNELIDLTNPEDRKIINRIETLINYKKSALYNDYTKELTRLIRSTSDTFLRMQENLTILANNNLTYQPSFKEESNRFTSLVDLIDNILNLLSLISLRYPTINSFTKLINDGDFETVLNVIDDVYRNELKTMGSLLNNIDKDYKYIRSLESFLYKDSVIDNGIIFNIMEDFDKEMNSIYNNPERNPNMPRLIEYLGMEHKRHSDPVAEESFTNKLNKAEILTDPFYDLFNYYRLFLFHFTNQKTYLTDLIETLFIFNSNTLKDSFKIKIKDIFEIKLKNIDYKRKNIDDAKINESITSKYKSLSELNMFPIEHFIEEINKINTNVKITSSMLSSIKSLDAFQLIMFSITEKILYDKLDLKLILEYLSEEINVKTTLFKIFFKLAIDNIIEEIEAILPDPDTLSFYNYIKSFKEDRYNDEIDFIKRLTRAKKFYEAGDDDILSLDNIIDWEQPSELIWTEDKQDKIKELFISLIKEV